MTTYTQEELFCLFFRGFHFCFSLYTTLYFILFKKEKAIFSYFFALCGVMLTISITIGTLARYYDMECLSVEVDGLFDLSIVPAFAAFGYTLVNQKTKWWKVLLGWCAAELPVLACGIIYFLMPDDTIIIVALIYIVAFIIVVVIWGFVQINRYNRLLKDSYSDIDNRTLTWFKVILGAMIGIVLAYFVIGKSFNIEYIPALQPIYFFGTEVLIFIIAYFVNKQENVDNDIMDEADTSMNSATDDDGSHVDIAERLKTDFEDQKLYTKSNITIKDLANTLGSNSKYVSQYINNVLGKNFNQYINELRVREACEIMRNDSTISFEDLAKAVGFTSRATFWRIFEIECLYTPTRYRKNLEDSSDDSDDSDDFDDFGSKGVLEPDSDLQSISHELSSLSPREKKLCRLIIDGSSNQQQREALGIQENSLRVMRSRLKRRLRIEAKENLADYLLRYKNLL